MPAGRGNGGMMHLITTITIIHFRQCRVAMHTSMIWYIKQYSSISAPGNSPKGFDTYTYGSSSAPISTYIHAWPNPPRHQ